MVDQDMKVLIAGLTDHLGRLPTEEEVYQFIFGDEKQRQEIWNKASS